MYLSLPAFYVTEPSAQVYPDRIVLEDDRTGARGISLYMSAHQMLTIGQAMVDQANNVRSEFHDVPELMPIFDRIVEAVAHATREYSDIDFTDANLFDMAAGIARELNMESDVPGWAREGREVQA